MGAQTALTTAVRTGAGALMVLALAACTGAPGGGPTPSASASGTPGASPATQASEAAVETITVAAGGTDVDVTVHPLVRAGELAVLTLDLTADAARDSGEDLYVGDVLSPEILPIDPLAQVRLVDLDAGTVYQPAQDVEGRPVQVGDATRVAPNGTRLQVAYAAPPDDVETLGLLFPGAYLPDLPVIEGAVPAPVAGAGADAASASPAAVDGEPAVDPIDLTAVTEPRVFDLQSYTRELDGVVATQQTTQEVEVTLGGDVLFDSSSAELTPKANAVLDAAAAQLQAREPGEVEIVGHTDDVDDDSFNQKLSEQRAKAVADALGQRVDTSAYPLRPSGRGESEPLVPNDTDENRALNRRVTLTLRSTVTSEIPVPTEGDLPPFDGPTGTGAEGVEVDAVRPYRVTAPRATRVGGHLVLEVRVEALDDAVDPSFGPAFFGGIGSFRGYGINAPQKMFGSPLLSGSTAVYPLDYQVHVDDATGLRNWYPLADLDTIRRVDGGQSSTFIAIYPAFSDATTVTLQNPDVAGSEAFRLTDIPVVS